MMNVLLLTDFSENSWNAIKYALNFYAKTTCNFYLLHVNRLSYLATGDIPYVPTQAEIENLYVQPKKKQLKALLKQISIELPENKNHKFFTLTDYNFFIESIRKYVKEKNFDVIVMGTKGASGLKEHLVGSNTGDVITKVKCTTLVVPEKAEYKTIKEIAFPTDFNLSYDISALQPIADILEQKKSTLGVLHIMENGERINAEQQQNKEIMEAFFDGFDYSFHFITNKKTESAIQFFVESRNLDLIVMVAKNLNYFQQIFFNSKVEKISYHTKIPFLVIHE